MNWPAIALSLKLSSVVCLLLLVIGVPIAYWLAFSKWRWKFLAESVVALPLVLPPTVLGFYVLLAIGSRSPVGRLWNAWFGHGLAFTFEGLVIASMLYSLPFTVQPLAASFSQVDRQLLDASSILGASKVRTFLRIIVPLSMPGIVTGVVLGFAHTIGEFGVVLMVGGNIPGARERYRSRSMMRSSPSIMHTQTRRRCCCCSSHLQFFPWCTRSTENRGPRGRCSANRPASVSAPTTGEHAASPMNLTARMRKRLSADFTLDVELNCCRHHDVVRSLRLGQNHAAALHRGPAASRFGRYPHW